MYFDYLIIISLTDCFRTPETDPVFCLICVSSDLHLSELSEHRLLLAERCEGDASDNPDRHLQLQQLQQQTYPQGLCSDQGLLWQGEDGLLTHLGVWSAQQWADHLNMVERVFTLLLLSVSTFCLLRTINPLCVLQGAERKLRDEEKKQLRKRMKGKNIFSFSFSLAK